MYHYVRNPELTAYKNIKAVRESEFKEQLGYLSRHYEIIPLNVALEFWNGNYQPKKNLCLLTFDDGLKEHANFVTNELSKRGLQGLFFIPTACIAEGYVLPVHKNHFLLASLDFEYYQQTFLENLQANYPNADLKIDLQQVKKTYRWDEEKVAEFKFLLTYKLEKKVRNHILSLVFEKELGDEKTFAESLYLNWTEAKNMQAKGMILGGHTNSHPVLAHLSEAQQQEEIETCTMHLKMNIAPQECYPFSYPFGKSNTFTNHTIECLKTSGYACSFTTEIKHSGSNEHLFEIGRIDPKDIRKATENH